MAGRRVKHRAVKKHFNYTVEEVSRLLGVAKGTVRRWLKQGLPHLSDQRPFLILGVDLVDFLNRAPKPRQSCALDEFFCFRCRAPRRPAADMIEYLPRNAMSGHSRALCATCCTVMHKNISASDLPALQRIADVAFPQGDPRLTDRTEPHSNDHLNRRTMA